MYFRVDKLHVAAMPVYLYFIVLRDKCTFKVIISISICRDFSLVLLSALVVN